MRKRQIQDRHLKEKLSNIKKVSILQEISTVISKSMLCKGNLKKIIGKQILAQEPLLLDFMFKINFKNLPNMKNVNLFDNATGEKVKCKQAPSEKTV